MHKKRTKVINETGLHARPATDFVDKAKEFNCKIQLRRIGEEDNEFINAKSIMMLLSLGIEKDEEIEITAEGDDEVQAVESLIQLIESGFGEL